MTSTPPMRTRTIAPRRVLVDDVYDAVTALLMDGEIAPGDRANIESIARELGVSPTPVREALARLESEGLVVKQALKGYTAAAPLDAKGFDDLFAVRLLLEPGAARLAATRIEAPALGEMRSWVDDMMAAASGSVSNARYEDYKTFALEDANLHRTIAESSGNPLLAESITRLRPHRHNYRLYFESGIAQETNSEHDAIVRALEEGDGRAAERAMHAHLANSRGRTAAYFADRSAI
jgi:DNA-binding GntR family transcriptional regulator